jgi:hypothetical protein
MRVIINDKRYGALKTLGERKQAFNEVSSLLYELESVLAITWNVEVFYCIVLFFT